MAKAIQEVKFIRVTDTDLDGDETVTIHSVGANWTQPNVERTETYQVITEDEARAESPALFGIVSDAAPAELTIEELEAQVAEVQAALESRKAFLAAKENIPKNKQ